MTAQTLVLSATWLASERAVFTVAGEAYSWVDVVAAARLRGEWPELERAAAESLACLRRLTASGEELDLSVLADAERRFRVPRGLLTGEETVEWLERRQLTAPEWRDYLRRAAARDRWADELAETVARFPVAREDVQSVLWAEAVCSGFLDEAAAKLAGDAALAAEAGETMSGARDGAFSRITVAADRMLSAAVTPEAVAREVALHRLEWLRVDGVVVELPTEGMAREIAFCVRDDGRPLVEVAVECLVWPRAYRVYLDEAPDGFGPSLLGAGAGDLVGPLRSGDCYALLLVEAKVAPVAADPDVRRKAVERLTARAVERATAANVSWCEPV
jgi:hypothetical protein